MDFTNFLVILGESLGYPAFWLGLFLVGLFAQNRFAQSKVISGIDDPQAVPRSFTTRFRYFLSSFAYIGYFEFFYGLLVGIGSLPVLQKLLTQWVGGLDAGMVRRRLRCCWSPQKAAPPMGPLDEQCRWPRTGVLPQR